MKNKQNHEAPFSLGHWPGEKKKCNECGDQWSLSLGLDVRGHREWSGLQGTRGGLPHCKAALT